LSSPTTPLTAAQVAAIQQQFNVASVRSYPPNFWETITGLISKSPTAIFQLLEEPDGSLSLSNSTLPQSSRLQRANSLLINGYQAIMLYDLCWLGYDHFETYNNWAQDGITWYPPRYINGTLQPALGDQGQYALPGAYSEGLGLLGPYPTTKPEGWITVPPVAQLLVPGADVAGLLKGWF
jgi:hypothetical protein